MFQTAFGRAPTSVELEQSVQFLAELTNRNEQFRRAVGPNQLWQDFAQSLFNFKEFIYVR